MFLHAAEFGYTSIAIRTVDTDVVVLAVALQQRIPNVELRTGFVSGGKVRYSYANESASTRVRALFFCHAFAGKENLEFIA
jgi:hypothetical protein